MWQLEIKCYISCDILNIMVTNSDSMLFDYLVEKNKKERKKEIAKLIFKMHFG